MRKTKIDLLIAIVPLLPDHGDEVAADSQWAVAHIRARLGLVGRTTYGLDWNPTTKRLERVPFTQTLASVIGSMAAERRVKKARLVSLLAELEALAVAQ